jgi:hypothetical protein
MTEEEAKQLTKLVDEGLGKIPETFDGKLIGRNLYLMAFELINAEATNSLPDLIPRARKGDQIAEGAPLQRSRGPHHGR